MDDFDHVAYLKAYKALYVIFIILILLANGLLIYKNARKLDFIYKPRTLTILSLAIGDVILALFPMIVQTKHLFGDYMFTEISCETLVSALVYDQYLITFVYGIGLMVLGFEIVQSHKNALVNKNKKVIYSLAYSSFPWILGLIIILPLGMSNTCPVDNQTLSQGRTLVVIAFILPACGAFITSIVVMNRQSKSVNSPAQAFIDSSSQATAFTTLTPNPAGVIPVNPSESQTSTHAPPPTYPTTQGQFPNYPHQPPQFYNQPPHQPQQQKPPSFYNQPQQQEIQQFDNQPQQQQLPQFYNQPQHLPYYTPGQSQFGNPTYYPGNFNVSTTQTNSLITPATVPSNATSNAKILAAISIVNFFFVIPFAIFQLSYLPLNTDAVVLSPTIFLYRPWLSDMVQLFEIRHHTPDDVWIF